MNARFSNVVMVSPPPSLGAYPHPSGSIRIELMTKAHPIKVMVSETALPILLGSMSLFITLLDDSSSIRASSERDMGSDLLDSSCRDSSSPSSPFTLDRQILVVLPACNGHCDGNIENPKCRIFDLLAHQMNVASPKTGLHMMKINHIEVATLMVRSRYRLPDMVVPHVYR